MPHLQQVQLLQRDKDVVTTQSWERTTPGQNVDAFVDSARMPVSKILASRSGQKSGKRVL
jgi:hypothetical protein